MSNIIQDLKMACSTCKMKGHRANNRKFHPIKKVPSPSSVTTNETIKIKCSLCDKEGHQSDNKEFHPEEKPVAVPTIQDVKDINSTTVNTTEMSLSNAIENTIPPAIDISDEIRTSLSSNFAKCVKGYHLINDDPIKETPWEDINAIVLNASGCAVNSQSNGSHKSGGDLSCSLGGFSNKSTQYDSGNSSFKISSYRLTTVCSDKTPGKIEEIIAEINNRKNFAFYSIIVREDTENQILYDWYLIPSDFPALNPASYKWQPKLGKIGKNKGAITGWETDILDGSSMSITFSMSSQLWIDVNITEDIKKFIVGSCRVNRGRKYNYIQLYEKDCPAV